MLSGLVADFCDLFAILVLVVHGMTLHAIDTDVGAISTNAMILPGSGRLLKVSFGRLKD